jgi:hypothetical protein
MTNDTRHGSGAARNRSCGLLARAASAAALAFRGWGLGVSGSGLMFQGFRSCRAVRKSFSAAHSAMMNACTHALPTQVDDLIDEKLGGRSGPNPKP